MTLAPLTLSWYYYSFNARKHKAETEDIEEKQYDHNDVYSVVKVLWKETAFPRCKVTDSR